MLYCNHPNSLERYLDSGCYSSKALSAAGRLTFKHMDAALFECPWLDRRCIEERLTSGRNNNRKTPVIVRFGLANSTECERNGDSRAVMFAIARWFIECDTECVPANETTPLTQLDKHRWKLKQYFNQPLSFGLPGELQSFK